MTQQDWINAAAYVIHHWHQVVGTGVVALAISTMLQYIKRRTKLDQMEVRIMKVIHLDGPRLVVMLQTVLVGLGTAYIWLLDPANAKYIPARFGFLLATTFYVHRFLVSPLGTRLEKSLQPYLKALEAVKNSEVAVAAATTDKTLSAAETANAEFNPAASQNQTQPPVQPGAA